MQATGTTHKKKEHDKSTGFEHYCHTFGYVNNRKRNGKVCHHLSGTPSRMEEKTFCTERPCMGQMSQSYKTMYGLDVMSFAESLNLSPSERC